MVRILALVKALGVQWTRSEQERRLFPLCVHVQAVLMERHGEGYATPEVGLVPDEFIQEVKEIIFALFPQDCRKHSGATGAAESLSPT